MKLLDVNVLVYAAIQEADRHDEYRRWLANALGDIEGLACAPQTLASSIRILTHRGIWRRSLRIDQALSFAQTIGAAPAVVLLEPGPRHWEIFASLCQTAGAHGNLVMNAWLAALAMEHECALITTDRDFARFRDLRWRHPLD